MPLTARTPDRGATLSTDGLVIREFNGVGEADRFITVLTRDKGVIRAAVRGARRIKSRSGSGSGLLCFSRFCLTEGRDMYIATDVKPIEIFFELRNDMEKTALAGYFCELASALAPADEPADEALRLLLNALHFLKDGTRPLPLLKAVVEWRLLSLAGYMPRLDGCATCGRQTDTMYFSTLHGQLYCDSCPRPETVPLPSGTLTAIRRVCTGDLTACFSFTLPEKTLTPFCQSAEMFLKAQLGRSFKTLDFYHQVGAMP